MKLKSVLVLLLLSSLALGVCVRLVSLPALKGHLLLGTDPARYTRLAKIIVENGKLPQRDVMRSVPLGKETKNQLTLFPYFIACLSG